MATISTANFLSLADNIAKTCIDLETAFITNPSATSPTTATISAGITSLQSRVAGLNDIAQESVISPSALSSTSAAIAYLTFNPNSFYAFYAPLMHALDQHVSGLAAFVTANSLMLHPEFAAAFNYFAANASVLGITNIAVPALPLSAVFVPAEVSLATLSVTGATTGTYAAGTNINTTKYSAGQPLLLKNTAGSSLTTGLALTITYKDVNNATQSLPFTASALAAGATVALSISGQAVTNIVVTGGGVNGETVAVVAEPTRTIAY